MARGCFVAPSWSECPGFCALLSVLPICCVWGLLCRRGESSFDNFGELAVEHVQSVAASFDLGCVDRGVRSA